MFSQLVLNINKQVSTKLKKTVNNKVNIKNNTKRMFGELVCKQHYLGRCTMFVIIKTKYSIFNT